MFLIGQLSHLLPVKIVLTRVETSSIYGLTSLRNRGRKRKMYGLKMFKTWVEMSEQVRVETSWYYGLKSHRVEVSLGWSVCKPHQLCVTKVLINSICFCMKTRAWVALYNSFRTFQLLLVTCMPRKLKKNIIIVSSFQDGLYCSTMSEMKHNSMKKGAIWLEWTGSWLCSGTCFYYRVKLCTWFSREKMTNIFKYRIRNSKRYLFKGPFFLSIFTGWKIATFVYILVKSLHWIIFDGTCLNHFVFGCYLILTTDTLLVFLKYHYFSDTI